MSENKLSIVKFLKYCTSAALALLGGVWLIVNVSERIEKVFSLPIVWSYLIVLGVIAFIIILLFIKGSLPLFIKTFKILIKNKEKLEKYLSLNEEDLNKLEKYFTGQLVDTYLTGIKKHWTTREEAKPTIKEHLMAVGIKKIFIAAIGFNTVDFLTDSDVLRHLKEQIETNDLEITIVSLKNLDHYKRVRLESNDTLSDEKIDRFNNGQNRLKIIRDSFSMETHRNNIKFKCYGENIIPRHFILQVDRTIFFGSYLSANEGRDSYLIQLHEDNLQNNNSSLYKQFRKEITKLMNNSIEKEWDDRVAS